MIYYFLKIIISHHIFQNNVNRIQMFRNIYQKTQNILFKISLKGWFYSQVASIRRYIHKTEVVNEPWVEEEYHNNKN